MIGEFEDLYAPIAGSDPSPQNATATPESTLARTNRLREEYEDLQKELFNELSAVDQRMIQPASEARECFIPVKKTIKKRDDKKVCHDQVEWPAPEY